MWKTPIQRPARIKRKVTHPCVRIKPAKAASVNFWSAGMFFRVVQAGATEA